MSSGGVHRIGMWLRGVFSLVVCECHQIYVFLERLELMLSYFNRFARNLSFRYVSLKSHLFYTDGRVAISQVIERFR